MKRRDECAERNKVKGKRKDSGMSHSEYMVMSTELLDSSMSPNLLEGCKNSQMLRSNRARVALDMGSHQMNQISIPTDG